MKIPSITCTRCGGNDFATRCVRCDTLPGLSAFDYERLVEWMADPNRRPAQTAFTAGAARDAARAFEDCQRKMGSGPVLFGGPPNLKIGQFVLSRMDDNGKWTGIWIGIAGGEGGQFSEADLEAVLEKFYRERL